MFDSISTLALPLLAQAEVVQVTAEESIPWYQSQYMALVFILAAIALGIFLARFIAKSLRLNEYAGRMTVVLVCVILGAILVWSKWPPTFGVDLRGGINMVGSLNLEAWEKEQEQGFSVGDAKTTAKDIIPTLLQRVDPSGTREIMLRPLGDDKIEVIIPGVSLQEADDYWDRLVRAGKLEFRIVANRSIPSHASAITLAEESAKDPATRRNATLWGPGTGSDRRPVALWVPLARKHIANHDSSKGPLPIKFVPGFAHLVRDGRTGQMFQMSDVIFGNNNDFRGLYFAQFCDHMNIRDPQCLVMYPPEDQLVEGKHLKNIKKSRDERGSNQILFDLSNEGRPLFGRLTLMNKPDSSGERQLGIVLDKKLHSAPNIQEAIYGNGSITGDFSDEEIAELQVNLESGKLDVALNKNPISKNFIQSSLGEELKQKGIWAITASLLLVLVFMIFYYRFSGIVATIALLLNLLLILALIMAIRQPITLTGLAGLVLTVGMSVDANVLIYERIREELDRGAALRMAIRNGFDKATTTIVDANVTTLITAIVLYVIGSEQIKGFAVTLILGILISMFTAIYCARLFFDVAERKRWLTKLSMMRLLGKTQINFLGKRGFTTICSLALIGLGLFVITTLGPKILSHDLRGGSTAQMVFKSETDAQTIRDTLNGKDLLVNDEEVDFTVAPLTDVRYPNRLFKVDSSIPSYGGEDTNGDGTVDESDRWKQLDEVLQDTFGDQLEKYNVTVELGEASVPRKSRKESYIASAARALSMTNPTMLLQDTVQAQEEPETVEPPAENAEATTEPAQTEPTQNGEQESLPNESDFQAGEGDAPMEPVADIKVTRNFNFNFPVSGKSLRNMLVTSGERTEKVLAEDQMTFTSADVQQDESAMTTLSQSWKVTFDVPNEADVDTVITDWKTEFNKKPYFPTTSGVGGQIAQDTQLQALGAIIASLIGIIAYVWIRFQNVAFGLAAVIALVHDVLIVLGAIALSHWLAGSLGVLGIEKFKISLPIVAALLTIIGYSLNDTIVVFDRIREVRGKRTEITAEMINTSICQTLSRTILTSITTFIVVFILYCFGGEAIHGFAFALVVGVIVGTYSSIFIASPALLLLMNRFGLNPGAAQPE